ncbi:MAG: ImmA/IrrE family metallo-endopeptidase [Porticoccaceae bacterium]|nr:ImmA/IrrE family metallo-endopeptidase [Porticoccaceae bacterium]
MNWPDIFLREVPADSDAKELALSVRSSVFDNEKGLFSKCDLRKICESGKFEVTTADFNSTEIKTEALLVPMEGDKFRIVLPVSHSASASLFGKGVTRHRNRFRIAHEIAHSFFYKRNKNCPVKLTQDSKAEEDFCDLFASYLLMPFDVVSKLPRRPESVDRIGADYDVSLEAAGRSLAKANKDILVLGLSWKENPRDKNIGLRVQWSAGDLADFIPNNTRLHSPSALEAFESSKSIENIEYLAVGNLRGMFHISVDKKINRNFTIAILSLPSMSEITHMKENMSIFR